MTGRAGGGAVAATHTREARPWSRMAEEKKVRNATERGRYGEAPKDEPHLSPEVEPVTMEGSDAAARKPPVVAGALPENERDPEGK